MKNFFGLFLSLILVSCSLPQKASAPAAGATPSPVSAAVAAEDRSQFKSGLVESQQAVLNGLPGASVYHLDFEIAEDLYHVSGHEQVTYTNTETTALDQIQLRLFPNLLGGEMTVSNIEVDGQAVTPSYGLANSLLILPLVPALEVGQSKVIEMDFAVTIARDVESSYGFLAYFDNILALAHAYPMISVYDERGWNSEIPPRYGDITFSDAAFYLVKITAPNGVTLVTTGSLLSRTEQGETQTLLVADGPARDFFLAASSDFQKVSQTFGDVTINSYAPTDLQDGAKEALQAAGRSVELYSKLYVPYPYTELDIVATPTVAGGIEYPGLFVVTLGVYEAAPGDPVGSSRQALEGIVAHEAAHQWFYNLVGDDQLDEPWLDESLAQYLTLEYFADKYGSAGEQAFLASLRSRWKRVDNAPIPIGLPVAKYTEQEYGAIVYGRGPLFFVALKKQMGAAAFDAFLKDYIAKLSWGIATREIMQSLAAEHCSCDLDPIFKEWVHP